MKWTDIQDPQDQELDRLAEEHGIHPLHIEDCRARNQRAKVEEGAGYIFLVLKTVRWVNNSELEIHDLDVFLGNDWVITVLEGSKDYAGEILKPIHAAKERLRPDQIFYRVADGVVDSYLPVLDCIDDLIDDLEEGALTAASPEFLSRIFSAKRTLIDLRRILVNTRDVAAHLYRTEHELIQKDLIPFLRDIYDHVARNLDLVETQRDLLSETMDVYLSSVANRTNQVMKTLTFLGTVALPILLISSFYGMNTDDLPLAKAPHATLIIGSMMSVGTLLLLGLIRWFRWF